MKSWSRQQMEAEMRANPRRKSNKVAGEFRNIPAGCEDEIQAQFFKWIDSQKHKYPVLEQFYAIPNGTYLTKFGQYVMKITGRRSGVPDTHLPVPAFRNGQVIGTHGLWIEFKTPGKYPSPEQKIWIEKLRTFGHRVEVCRSWIDAANVTIEYLNLPLEKL